MYSEELKQQVLEARKNYGYSVPKLVEKYGVARPTIYLWLKEAKEQHKEEHNNYPYISNSEIDIEERALTIQKLKDRIKQLEEQNNTLMLTLKLLVNKH